MKWTATDLGLESDGWIVGPRPTEDMLAAAYLAMRQDGSINLISHQSPASLQWFLTWLMDPGCIVLGAYEHPTPDVTRLVGMGFINDIQRLNGLTKAEVGFAFWGERQPGIFMKAELIRAMVDIVFTKTDIESLLGLTPERNPGAAALIRRVGMKQFGPVPDYVAWHGEPCGAFISQASKVDWLNRRK